MQGSLPICDMIMQYSKEYQKGQDFIAEFIQEKLIVGGPNDRVKKAQITSLFNTWCHDMFRDNKKSAGKTQELYGVIEKHFRITYKNGEYRGICIKRDTQDLPLFDSSQVTDSESDTVSTVTKPDRDR